MITPINACIPDPKPAMIDWCKSMAFQVILNISGHSPLGIHPETRILVYNMHGIIAMESSRR